MHNTKNQPATAPSSPGMLGPGGDEAFGHLTSPDIRRRVLVAHLVEGFRRNVQDHLGRPLGRILLRHWMAQRPGSARIEAFGLPRHTVEEVLGDDALTLYVDPRKLIRLGVRARRKDEKRPSSMAFIWDGTWDQRREDLRIGTRYRLISEIDQHRDSLHLTERYGELMQYIERGTPWVSHQLGIRLDTPEKIEAYLRAYLDFLDDMAVNGFDEARGKDPLGVAITREGTIVKVNRGLHRLAMAQRLGVPSVPVRVRHVHRLWWERVTDGKRGAAALEAARLALQACMPEESPGPLDEDAPATIPADFWPPRRLPGNTAVHFKSNDIG